MLISPPLSHHAVLSRWLFISTRLVAAIALVQIGFATLLDGWRAMEAVIVVGALRWMGDADIHRFGHQLLATSRDGQPFSASIGPWCSSLGVVLVLAAVAGTLVSGRRWRAFLIGSSAVIVGNLVRIIATMMVGLHNGPGAIEAFHDSYATWFAVMYTLASVALFAAVLAPARRALRSDRRRPLAISVASVSADIASTQPVA